MSVLLLNHNSGRFINETIQSIVLQSYTKWEMIIVDDGSLDGSLEVIQRWEGCDARIKVIQLPQKTRKTKALNLGLARTKGEYIARVDSDDIWLPMLLEKQLNLMEQVENGDIGVCGANCLLIDSRGQVTGKKEFPLSHEECIRAFWYRNPICQPAALIRKCCFEQCGGYDEGLDYAEDLELWIRFGQQFRLTNLPEYLIKYRLYSANSTLREHRANVNITLKIRKQAISKYGYRISCNQYVSFAITWCMQWLPATLVRHFFHKFFLTRYQSFSY